MNHPEDRIEELLADRTLEGLSPAESAELDRLLEASPEADPDSLDLAAAALAVALANPEPMPEGLRAKVMADTGFNPRPPKPRVAAPTRRQIVARRFQVVAPWTLAAMGWFVAAVSLATTVAVIALSSSLQSPPPGSPEIRIERLRAEVGSMPLKATAHPLAKGSSGELIWSQGQQSGYLELTGLAPVDPARGAYQLWIFDESRDPRYPVDGGVFSVAGGSKSAIVAIHSHLHVDRPGLFAVTLEPPGGVVVSDRTRILLTAGPWKPRPPAPREERKETARPSHP